MSRELSNIDGAIGQVRSLLFELESRSSAGFESSFATVFDRLTLAVNDLPAIHVHELETACIKSSAPVTLSSADKAAVVATVSGGITSEDRRTLRRLGLDTKYVGIKSEGDLFDMKQAESKARGGN